MRGRGRVAVSGVQSGVVMTSPHSGGGRGAARDPQSPRVALRDSLLAALLALACVAAYGALAWVVGG